MDIKETVALVQERTGYVFSDEKLILEALTHSSYANEMKINKRNNYERLEFLGDAVLEMISSEVLFARYPDVPEGGLTKKRAALVCEPSLAICARKMGLGQLMFLGKGEERSGGRDKEAILCDIVEAVLGAIYLDGGLEAAREYVNTHILSDLEDEELFVNFKSELQEMVSKLIPEAEPSYDTISQEGPEHDRTFVVEVTIGDKIRCEGVGKTKKAAQQEAAKKAISIIKGQESN